MIAPLCRCQNTWHSSLPNKSSEEANDSTFSQYIGALQFHFSDGAADWLHMSHKFVGRSAQMHSFGQRYAPFEPPLQPNGTALYIGAHRSGEDGLEFHRRFALQMHLFERLGEIQI